MKKDGLSVSSSEGYLRQVEVPKSKRNPALGTTTVTELKLPDMAKPFRTDPGFNRSHGFTALADAPRVAFDKLRDVSAPIAAKAAQSLNDQGFFKAALDRNFSAWVKAVQADFPAQRRIMPFGAMTPADVTFLAERRIAIENPILEIDDRQITGAKALRHQQQGNALTDDEWQTLPAQVRKAEAVLFDVVKGNLLYVLAGSDKVAKVVVQPNYKVKDRVSQSARTVFKIAEADLRGGLAGGRYMLVRGKLNKE